MDILEAIGKVQLIKISGIGRDRLGIVNKVAALIESNRGNIILERSMRAAEDFATIVIAEFEEDNQAGIESSLRAFQDGVLGSDFFVSAQKYSILSGRRLNPEGKRYTVVIEGHDQSGLVASITLTLLQFGLNLDGTDSEVTYEPFSGTKKFTGSFDFTIPDGFDLDAFEAEVRQVAENNGLEVLYIKELPPKKLTN